MPGRQLTTEQQLTVEFVNDHTTLYRTLVDEARLSDWWPKNRRKGGKVQIRHITATCLGVDIADEHHACEREVSRPANRRELASRAASTDGLRRSASRRTFKTGSAHGLEPGTSRSLLGSRVIGRG